MDTTGTAASDLTTTATGHNTEALLVPDVGPVAAGEIRWGSNGGGEANLTKNTRAREGDITWPVRKEHAAVASSKNKELLFEPMEPWVICME
jgi:hypothetical protein